MNFAFSHDPMNEWFCLLTDSCCPIISPRRFRYLFYENYSKSIMNWRKSWWNIEFHRRANLHKLPEEMRLANDPWFVLKRENVWHCLQFAKNQQNIIQTINGGGLANESLFAIILFCYNQLDKVVASATHMADWGRQSSTTSPHLFLEGDELDIQFIERNLLENEYAMFIRKIHPEFPDEVLKKYIYDFSSKRDAELVLRDPFFKMRLYYYYDCVSPYFLYFVPCVIIIWYYFYF